MRAQETMGRSAQEEGAQCSAYGEQMKYAPGLEHPGKHKDEGERRHDRRLTMTGRKKMPEREHPGGGVMPRTRSSGADH